MASLEDRIADAFADNQYPGDDHLTTCDPADRVLNEKFQLLRGKEWRDCPVRELMPCDQSIPELTPAAFHYYMPAFLIASLDPNKNRGFGPSLVLLIFLTPPASIIAHVEKIMSELPHGNFAEPLLMQGRHSSPNEISSLQADIERRLALFTSRQLKVMVQVLCEYVRCGMYDPDFVRGAVEFLTSRAGTVEA